MLLALFPSFLNSPLSILSKISRVFLFSSLILFSRASICEIFLFSFSSQCGSVSPSGRPRPLSQTPGNYQPLSSNYPTHRLFSALQTFIFRFLDFFITFLWPNFSRKQCFSNFINLKLRSLCKRFPFTIERRLECFWFEALIY